MPDGTTAPHTGRPLVARSFGKAALALSLPVLLLAACSGGAVPVDEPGPTSAPDGGGPTGSLVDACPSALPATGAACSKRGLDCEYGDDWNPACNAIAQCWRGGPLDGTWQVLGPSTSPVCPSPTTLAPGCPATRPAAADSCSTPDLFCMYPGGRCLCFQSTSSGPMPMTTTAWACTGAPAAGCPTGRPRVGSACSDEGLACNYAVCDRGGMDYCDAGVWTAGIVPNFCSGG